MKFKKENLVILFNYTYTKPNAHPVYDAALSFFDLLGRKQSDTLSYINPTAIGAELVDEPADWEGHHFAHAIYLFLSFTPAAARHMLVSLNNLTTFDTDDISTVKVSIFNRSTHELYAEHEIVISELKNKHSFGCIAFKRDLNHLETNFTYLANAIDNPKDPGFNNIGGIEKTYRLTSTLKL